MEAGFIRYPQAVLTSLRGSLWLQVGAEAVEAFILMEDSAEAEAGSGGLSLVCCLWR